MKTEKAKYYASRIWSRIRAWLVKLWVTHGAGFYGLGFLITYIMLEVETLTEEFGEADDVGGFVSEQAIEFVFRFGIESFMNGIQALFWPLTLMQSWGYWGIAALVAGYLGFEHVARPIVESAVPELKEAREKKEREKEGEEADDA